MELVYVRCCGTQELKEEVCLESLIAHKIVPVMSLLHLLRECLYLIHVLFFFSKCQCVAARSARINSFGCRNAVYIIHECLDNVVEDRYAGKPAIIVASVPLSGER